MTKLLERAMAVAAALPEEQQNAIAAHILAEIEDERQWERRFAETSDEQWDALAQMARASIEEGGSKSLDELIKGE